MAELFEHQPRLVTTSPADLSTVFEQAIALAAGQSFVDASTARRGICSHRTCEQSG